MYGSWIYNDSKQAVHITTNIVRSIQPHGDVYSIQHLVIKFVKDMQKLGSFSDIPVSSTNKTENHGVTENVKCGAKHHNLNSLTL